MTATVRGGVCEYEGVRVRTRVTVNVGCMSVRVSMR